MHFFLNNLAEQVYFKILVILISVRRLSILLCVVSVTPHVYGDNFATKPIVIMEGSNNLSRVCLYENKTYSLGAVILVGKIYLDCVPEKKIETDGRLRWEKIRDEPQNSEN